MTPRRRAAAAGAAYLAAVTLYAVLAGIAPEPVREPSFRIPGLLFTVIVPAVAAFLLGSGTMALWDRFRLRGPAAGLAVGSIAAVAEGPTAEVAWLLLLGGLAWLALPAAVELLVRTVRMRFDGTTSDVARLTPAERAGAAGAITGLAYTFVFIAAAVVPRWTGASGPEAPGAVEAILTVAFLAGAFCLLLGLPVAFAVRDRLFSPLVVPALWIGQDLLSGWRLYDTGEVAVIAFTLGWPVAMVLVVALAGAESLLRRGWRRLRGSPPSADLSEPGDQRGP